jgi:hypothetical protein
MPYRSLLLIFSVFSLGACAYAIDKSIQDVKVVTPGARGSVCRVYVDGLRYDAYPPQTISVSKSSKEMIVDCLAPGNRRKEIVIKPQIAKTFYANAANAFIGAPVDAMSGAMYEYPTIIEVNFVNTPVRDEDPPAQNASDIKQPEEYRIEQFGPITPILNDDYSREGFALQRRQSSAGQGYIDQDISTGAPGRYSDKGDLQPVTTTINIPADSGDSDAISAEPSAAPVPLYPGN